MKFFIILILLVSTYNPVFGANIQRKTVLITAANGEIGEGVAFSLS